MFNNSSTKNIGGVSCQNILCGNYSSIQNGNFIKDIRFVEYTFGDYYARAPLYIYQTIIDVNVASCNSCFRTRFLTLVSSVCIYVYFLNRNVHKKKTRIVQSEHNVSPIATVEGVAI